MEMKDKTVVLGVTGSIAAYKAAELASQLTQGGARVEVIMTEAATKFVAPLTFSALSGHEVASDLWARDQSTGSEVGTQHIDLATWADVLLIAPASANTIGKLTYGLSDNLLTIVALASKAPIILAPTMDADMYINPVTQRNIMRLQERGCFIIPAEEGEHASGLMGPGRLQEIRSIIQFVERVLDKTVRDLSGKNILITAGPTYEAIDPVRFIGNRSSGKMGFALASAAAFRGAAVTLITGPVHLETPRNVTRVDIESAEQMHKAVLARAKKVDAVIMAAAVADYAPSVPAHSKIKKEDDEGGLTLRLRKTPDVLLSLGRKKNAAVLVGFALETDDELRNAREKLKKKNLDLVILNSLADKGAGFGSDTNVVTIIDRRGKAEKLPLMSKFDVANRVLDRVKALL